MEVGHCFEDFCAGAIEGTKDRQLILEVFVKSVAGALFDTESRLELIGEVLENVKNIPFVPTPVVRKVLDYGVAQVGHRMEVALNEAIVEHKRRPPGTLEASHSELPPPKKTQGSFTRCLRGHLHSFLLKDALERFGRNVGTRLHFLLLELVDQLLDHIDTAKLEAVMAPLAGSEQDQDTPASGGWQTRKREGPTDQPTSLRDGTSRRSS